MKFMRLPLKVVAFLLIAGTIIYRHKIAASWGSLSDPVIDLIVYIGIGVLTAFLAILAGHVGTNRKLYRWMFWLGGITLAAFFVIAGVRGYRATLKVVEPKDIVMDAVNKANENTNKAVEKANQHTDGQVATVRDVLKKQIGSVKEDLKGTMVSVTGLISKTANDLNSAIAKVGKPDPPVRAKIQFTLWGDGKSTSFPLTVYPLKADTDGAFPVDFNFTNTSGATASKIDFWVYVCDECSYFKEPSGFDKPNGLDEHARHRVLPGFLNPGASFEKTTILVKTAKQLPWFDLAFRYSCETCGPLSDPQTVKIFVLP